jgi:hypothetical protein
MQNNKLTSFTISSILSIRQLDRVRVLCGVSWLDVLLRVEFAGQSKFRIKTHDLGSNQTIYAKIQGTLNEGHNYNQT